MERLTLGQCLFEEIEQLKKENEELKQINEEHRKLNGELRNCIIKTIEWVNTHDIDDCWELLEILKESESE